jgi:hypothetical protein
MDQASTARRSDNAAIDGDLIIFADRERITQEASQVGLGH